MKKDGKIIVINFIFWTAAIFIGIYLVAKCSLETSLLVSLFYGFFIAFYDKLATWEEAVYKYWDKRKKKKRSEEFEQTVGRPNFNLVINPQPDTMVLDISSIETRGSAIQFAKKHILGDRYVTVTGLLMPGHVENLPCHEAIFPIADNMEKIIAMKSIFENDLEQESKEMSAYFRYAVTGEIEFIGIFAGFIYLLSEKEKYIKEKVKKDLKAWDVQHARA